MGGKKSWRSARGVLWSQSRNRVHVSMYSRQREALPSHTHAHVARARARNAHVTCNIPRLLHNPHLRFHLKLLPVSLQFRSAGQKSGQFYRSRRRHFSAWDRLISAKLGGFLSAENVTALSWQLLPRREKYWVARSETYLAFEYEIPLLPGIAGVCGRAWPMDWRLMDFQRSRTGERDWRANNWQRECGLAWEWGCFWVGNYFGFFFAFFNPCNPCRHLKI